MTRDEHKKLWSDPEYELSVRTQAVFNGTDGCTGVPDFYKLGCYEHDIGYATGKDPIGNPITKKECDKRFRWYIQMKSPFGVLSPMSWWRWAAVSVLGKWRS